MEKKLTNEEIVEVVGALEKSKLKLSKNALVLIQYLQKELEEKEYFRQKWGKMFIQKNREAKKLKEEKEDLEERLKEQIFKYRDLQVENERLKKYKSMWAELDTKNAELQEQVDELKLELQGQFDKGVKAGCLMSKVKEQQTIKDTAKEIYDWLVEHPIDDNFIHIKKYLTEKYGLEVE